MDLTQLANLGEFVGGVAVLVTLLYLTYQLRETNRSTRVATLCAMSEASASLADMLAADPEVSRVFLAGSRDTADLTPDERDRFHFLMLGAARRMESVHIRMDGHGIPTDDRAGYHESGLSLLAMPGSLKWWSRHRSRFNPSFGEWVDTELARRGRSETDAV